MEDAIVVQLRRKASNWAKTVEEIVKLERKTFPKHESLSTFFDQELRKRNSELLYLEKDGEFVGFVMYSFHSSLSACITKLAVKEQWRSQGHGETLFKAAISNCRTRKVSRITLHVDPLRTAAFNLYKKYGFQVDSLVEGYYSSDRNAYRMYLDFDAQ